MTRTNLKRKFHKTNVIKKENKIAEQDEDDTQDDDVYFNTVHEAVESSASEAELSEDDGEIENVLDDFVNEVSSNDTDDEDKDDDETNDEDEGDDEIDDEDEDDNETNDEDEGDDEDESNEESESDHESIVDKLIDEPESSEGKNEFETRKIMVRGIKNSGSVIKSVKIPRGTIKAKASNEIAQNETDKINNTSDTKRKEKNEYEDGDTSDEEDIRNTVGNIPLKWYEEYKHIGYDWDGKQIIKPDTGDVIDNFLKKIEDPDFWRTVKDPQTGKEVLLSDEDLQYIKRIKEQKYPDLTFNDEAPWIEWFTSEVMQMPIRKFPEHKRSFLPSRDEAKKVSKLVHALKMGWIKTRDERNKERKKKEPQFYMLWQTDDQAEDMRRIHKNIPPPKRPLPGDAESYNPPAEYLFDEKELKQWNNLKDTPRKRKLHFVPQKYKSLREVPAYSRYIKERFLRCMDLYLCPRAIRMRVQVEPEDLVPKLPSPKDLQPFPNLLAIEYKGHTDMVRSITTDKTGQYLASGSDDFTVKVWEVNTGRCLRTFKTDAVVRSIEWCPNEKLPLILLASGNRVILLNPNVGDFHRNTRADEILKEKPQSEVIVGERVKTTVKWEDPTEEEYENQRYRIVLAHFKQVTQVTWHGKGDYFASVMPDGANRSVLVSQISKRRSQLPFAKSKGLIQCVIFHPSRPYLFVATQRHVRIYDLVKQSLVKKLLSNSQWISQMAIHPGGDNLLVATYDRKLLWFDLDLSTEPYQALKLHGTAVRGAAYHKRYPLFASGSDDGCMIVSHGMVYNDLLKNPLIVPLKRFQHHKKENDFGIFAVHFHPFQPWVFSAGSDATIKLYSN